MHPFTIRTPITRNSVSTRNAAAQLTLWRESDALERLCQSIVEDQGLLVEESSLAEDVLARATGTLKRGATRFTEQHLSHIVRLAIDESLDKDRVRLALGHADARPGSTRDQFIVEALGFPPDIALAVAVRFNSLPIPIRRAFLSVLIKHTPTEEVFLREGGWKSARHMARDLFHVLAQLRDPVARSCREI